MIHLGKIKSTGKSYRESRVRTALCKAIAKRMLEDSLNFIFVLAEYLTFPNYLFHESLEGSIFEKADIR